jgi:predicted transcriptional regulator
MTLRLDDDLLDRLREQAAAEQTSMQTLISRAVEQYLERGAKRRALADAVRQIQGEYHDVLRRLAE